MQQGWTGQGWRAVALLVVAAAVSGVAAQDQRSGTLKTVQGTVAISQGDAHRAAVLLLRDGTLITIGANTQVDISRFQFDATAQTGGLTVKVLVGTVRLVTGLLGKLQPDNVKVQTPSSTVAVRGTDFMVEVPQ